MSRQSFFQKIDQKEENSGTKITEHLKGWEKSYNSIRLELKPATCEWTVHRFLKYEKIYTRIKKHPESNREKKN